VSGGHNLSSDAAGGDAGTAPGGLLNAIGDRRNTDPLLGPLANTGGPTPTHALLAGSPAINAGDNCVLDQSCASNNLSFNLTTDQRGIALPQEAAVDIGAFEVVIPQACTTPPPGMVGWWDGDNNANDISGSGNNGSLQNGAAFAAGKVGQSFNLDGVDDFVSITNNGSLDMGTGNLTIDLWVNFNSLATDQTLFHKVSGSGSSANDPSYFVEYEQTNALRFRIGEGLSVTNDLIVPTSLVTGVWYHVAAVRSGNTGTLT
jgi:hypothetical protein